MAWRSRLGVAACTALLVSAAAAQDRWDRLLASPFMDRFAQRGEWQATPEPSTLTLTCGTCAAPVTITFAIDRAAGQAGPGLYRRARARYCQALAARRQGRCVGMTETRWRVLPGYRATSALFSGDREIAHVLFNGPEILRATLVAPAGSADLEALEPLLHPALAYLTPLW